MVRCYGFTSKQECPIIYTVSGQLIGNASEFVEHVRDKYLDGKPISAGTEVQKRRLHDNQEMIKEEWRKKKEGPTLAEKIEKHLEKVKKKEIVSHLIDTFFEQVNEGGCDYYVRYTDLQRDYGTRTVDVVDEFEKRAKEKREAEEKEAKRDIDFEEYKNEFSEYIEGKIPSEKIPYPSDDEEPGVKDKSRTKSKMSKGKNQSQLKENNDYDDAKSSKGDAMSKTGTSDRFSKSVKS